MFTKIRKIDSPQYFKQLVSLTDGQIQFKNSCDDVLKRNLSTREKFVAVVGPCSADDVESVTLYCKKLKEIADKVKDKIIVVIRVYTEKPHSNGEGYNGLVFEGINGINSGIEQCRILMRNCLEIGLPAANELLYPEHYFYFDDLVSYWFVGARSCEDTVIRAIASGADCPVGVKNPTDGNLKKLAQSMFAVGRSKRFLQGGFEVVTNGNKYCHAVLRGYDDGKNFYNNLDDNSINELYRQCSEQGLSLPFIMADLSHANSGKVAAVQLDNALKAVSDKRFGGVMCESYLYSGVSENGCGYSKTDDCLNIEQTKQMLLALYERL